MEAAYLKALVSVLHEYLKGKYIARLHHVFLNEQLTQIDEVDGMREILPHLVPQLSHVDLCLLLCEGKSKKMVWSLMSKDMQEYFIRNDLEECMMARLWHESMPDVRQIILSDPVIAQTCVNFGLKRMWAFSGMLSMIFRKVHPGWIHMNSYPIDILNMDTHVVRWILRYHVRTHVHNVATLLLYARRQHNPVQLVQSNYLIALIVCAVDYYEKEYMQDLILPLPKHSDEYSLCGGSRLLKGLDLLLTLLDHSDESVRMI
jgi:hypothetical protein